MSNNEVISTTFDRMFKSIDKEVDKEFISRQHNGTGYFNDLALTKFDSIEPRKFVDDDGRRGVIFPVMSFDRFIKNRVFFERYSDSDLVVTQHTGSHNPQEVAEELIELESRLREPMYNF